MKIIYKDYPETLKQLEDEVNNYIIEATEQRLLKISNLEKEALSEKIQATEEHIALMKKLDGLDTGNGEISFTYEDEARLIKQNLGEITKAINEFVAEKALENYLASLETRLEIEIKTNEEVTKDLKKNLDKRLEQVKKMYIQKEKATKDNVNRENDLIESGTNRLINILYNYTSDFSDIGAGWGQAIAEAFNNIMDSLTANIPYTATYNFEQGQVEQVVIIK